MTAITSRSSADFNCTDFSDDFTIRMWIVPLHVKKFQSNHDGLTKKDGEYGSDYDGDDDDVDDDSDDGDDADDEDDDDNGGLLNKRPWAWTTLKVESESFCLLRNVGQLES